MARGPNGSQKLRSWTLAAALLMTVAACASTAPRVASTGPSATTLAGPPTGTLPPLVAPPRSFKPVFSGDQSPVEKAFRASLAAYARRDVDAVEALTSKPSQSDRRTLLTFMNTYSVRLYRINAIVVNGITATIDYENAIVARGLTSNVTTLLGQHDVWTKEDGSWKFVSDQASAPGIPEDLVAVTVTLPDHAPIVVPSALPRTDFALLLKNPGIVTKGVFILGVPPALDVAAFIPVLAKIGSERDRNIAAPMPDGVLEMGATPDVPPHGTGTMVFSGRLPKGRYVLFSRTSSAGSRSLLPREYAEFTIR